MTCEMQYEIQTDQPHEFNLIIDSNCVNRKMKYQNIIVHGTQKPTTSFPLQFQSVFCVTTQKLTKLCTHSLLFLHREISTIY